MQISKPVEPITADDYAIRAALEWKPIGSGIWGPEVLPIRFG